MENRNYSIVKACPHCGHTDAKLMPPRGDYSEYQCFICGTYCISGTIEKRIENGSLNPRSAQIKEWNGRRCLVP